MTAPTPHFALAQHPTNHQWVLYVWRSHPPIECWDVYSLLPRWHMTRIGALQDARQYIEHRWCAVDAPSAIAEIDRLIAHERGHAGDEAAVQTIRALNPEAV